MQLQTVHVGIYPMSMFKLLLTMTNVGLKMKLSAVGDARQQTSG